MRDEREEMRCNRWINIVREKKMKRDIQRERGRGERESEDGRRERWDELKVERKGKEEREREGREKGERRRKEEK